jgi:hypothetical protein
MLLDAGIATVYRQTLISDPGDMPRYQWAEIWKSFYGEKTVGLTRYYAGMDHNDQIDLLIQVQRNRGLSPATDRVEIDGEYYRITQAQHVIDEEGLPMTDLSLERVESLE